MCVVFLQCSHTLSKLMRDKIAYLGIFISFILLAQKPGLWVHEWDIRVKDLERYIKVTTSRDFDYHDANSANRSRTP